MYTFYKAFFFVLIILGCESLYGQQQDSLIVISGKSQFESTIFSTIANYDDSLAESLYSDGVLFFRFRTAPNGKIVDVKCAEKQPSQLINIITATLQKMKLQNATDSTIYVLPIKFDYSRSSLWEFENIENLKKKYTVAYDVDDLDSYININNNGFFDIHTDDKAQWGLKSIFLPWISISRPVIYNYKDRARTLKQK